MAIAHLFCAEPELSTSTSDPVQAQMQAKQALMIALSAVERTREG
jgi:hypothetical protein